MRAPLLPAAAALMLGACSLAPHYERPAAAVPKAWPSGPAYGNTAATRTDDVLGDADTLKWETVFTDPRLQRLIKLSLENNRDLRVAILNVANAEAQFRVDRASIFPTLNATAAPSYTRSPLNSSRVTSPGLTSSSSSSTGTTTVTSSKPNVRTFSAGIGATSWELDLFGKARNTTRQSYENYISTAWTQRSTQMSLVAQVATAYLTVLADEDLLKLTQQTFDSQQHSYDLTQQQYNAGTTTMLALRQAQTSVETARANLALYQRQLAQDKNALWLLVGAVDEGDLPNGIDLDHQNIVVQPPGELPSTLLMRRPDVIAAEYTLRGANANIGAARAAFFPSITLTTSYGTASRTLGSLFSAGSSAWTFAPQITLPIFTAGANQGNLDRAKITRDIDIAQYDKTIQTAFREVSDALAGRVTYDDQIKAEQALVDAYADAYRLSDQRFRSGVDDYLTLLDSQRQLYSAQQSLISLKASRLENLVTLYRVLGGGWQ